MRKIQRARRQVDIGKLSSAVSRPGIDPRCWVTLAQVTDVGYDANEGFFVDVEFMPSGEQQCCLLGSHYAGENYGQAALPQVDDVVVVVIPNGDQGAGPVVIARLWNAADKPPSDGSSGTDPTTDYLLRIRESTSFKLYASGTGGVLIDTAGDGDIRLQARGAGKVKLGDTNLQPAVLGNDNQNVLNDHESRIAALEAKYLALVADYNGHTHTVTVSGVQPGGGSASGSAAAPTSFVPSPVPPVEAPETRATDTEVK